MRASMRASCSGPDAPIHSGADGRGSEVVGQPVVAGDGVRCLAPLPTIAVRREGVTATRGVMGARGLNPVVREPAVADPA